MNRNVVELKGDMPMDLSVYSEARNEILKWDLEGMVFDVSIFTGTSTCVPLSSDNFLWKKIAGQDDLINEIVTHAKDVKKDSDTLIVLRSNISWSLIISTSDEVVGDYIVELSSIGNEVTLIEYFRDRDSYKKFSCVDTGRSN